jgi:M6 family metalloprotease-like protein
VRIKLFIMILVAVFCTVGSMCAAPYDGDVITIEQPDGTLVDVKIWGDEYFQHVESLDGYTLTAEKDTGWATYAVYDKQSDDLVSTGIKYLNTVDNIMKSSDDNLKLQKGVKITDDKRISIAVKKREFFKSPNDHIERLSTSQNSALSGNIRGLTLLIDFSDSPATIAKSDIDNFLNLQGYIGYGNNGSVRDYYYDVSSGKVEYTNYVTAYYRAQNPKSYYNDTSVFHGIRTGELIHEALTYLENQGFDFSQLSVDSNNEIMAINAFYAGVRPSEWATGLWPHKWYLPYTGYSFSADGVSAGNYQITDIGSSLVLRTFCHENGHMICDWPDLYDYDYDSKGVGDFCLMGYGGNDWNPVPPCSYLRMLKGWDTVVNTTSSGGAFSELTNASYTTYLYENEDNNAEFFCIETRFQSDRNTSLPDKGVVIWHIDENGDRDSQQMLPNQHYIVSLEQADGKFDLENNVLYNYGDAADLFDTGDLFNDTTLPDAKWWDGSDSDLDIYDIVVGASLVEFTINGAAPDAGYSGGSGTETDPYLISNKDDLLALGANTDDYGKCFKQTVDIDLDGESFTKAVIAPDTDISVAGFQGPKFTGTFDGDGHNIMNLSIDGGSTVDYRSLFGYVGSGGYIKKTGLLNCNIIGNRSLGGLVSENGGGTISSCYFTGSVSGNDNVGGLVGYNNSGIIIDCYSTGSVSGDENVGGLVGNSSKGTISSCYSACSVSGRVSVGGLAGRKLFGTISDCLWDLQISGQTTSAGGTGKTTAEMQTESTFTAAGWDFVDTWYMVGYPDLQYFNENKDPYRTWLIDLDVPENKQGYLDDPADDGIQNLLKYAIGLDPMQSCSGEDVLAPLDDNQTNTFAVTYKKAKGIEYVLLFPIWTDSLIITNWGTNGFEYTMISETASNETWKATLPMTNDRGYIRLKAKTID